MGALFGPRLGRSPSCAFFLELVQTFKGGLLVERTQKGLQVTLNNPRVKEALETAKRWLNTISERTILEAGDADVIEIMMREKALFARVWISRLTYQSFDRKKFGIAPLPGGFGTMGGFGVGVNRASLLAKSDALRLIQALDSGKAQLEAVQLDQVVPVRNYSLCPTGSNRSNVSSLNECDWVFPDQDVQLVNRFAHLVPHYRQASQLIQKALMRVLTGDEEAQSVLDQLECDLSSSLDIIIPRCQELHDDSRVPDQIYFVITAAATVAVMGVVYLCWKRCQGHTVPWWCEFLLRESVITICQVVVEVTDLVAGTFSFVAVMGQNQLKELHLWYAAAVTVSWVVGLAMIAYHLRALSTMCHTNRKFNDFQMYSEDLLPKLMIKLGQTKRANGKIMLTIISAVMEDLPFVVLNMLATVLNDQDLLVIAGLVWKSVMLGTKLMALRMLCVLHQYQKELQSLQVEMS